MEKKIIHVVNLQSYGGIQKLVLQIANELNSKKGFVNTILPTKGVNSSMVSSMDSTVVHQVPGSNIFSKFFNTLKLFKANDIIHFHGPYTVYQFIALFSRKKITYTEHGTLQKANINRSVKHLIQKKIFGHFYLNNFVNTVFFVSNWLLIDLNLNNKVKQKVVYNGLEYQEPDEIKNNKFTLTIAARLIKKKRVHFAIDVMHLLKDNSNIQLQVIGDGPELESLKNRAGDLLNHTVFFLGYKPNAYDIIASSDIYLMTTYKEPFGLVVLEAMMGETLVLAIEDSGGALEIVGDEFPQLIVKNEREMAEKVLYWLDAKKEKSLVGEKLKELYLQKFTIRKMVSEIGNTYENIIN